MALRGRRKRLEVEQEKDFPVQHWGIPDIKRLTVLDMNSTESGELNSRKDLGVSGIEDQCLGPQFVLTAAHAGCYFWTRILDLIPEGHPRPRDAQEG